MHQGDISLLEKEHQSLKEALAQCIELLEIHEMMEPLTACEKAKLSKSKDVLLNANNTLINISF